MKHIKDIFAFIVVIGFVFGFYKLVMYIKEHNDKKDKQFYIVESPTSRYLTKNIDTSVNCIKFVDMDGRQVEIHGNYTLIKR